MTFKKIIDNYGKWFNDICIIYDSEIVRLVGLAEKEDDFYYIVRTPDRFISYYSCAGHIYSLKNKISEEQYSRLENHFELNNAPKEKTLILENYKD